MTTPWQAVVFFDAGQLLAQPHGLGFFIRARQATPGPLHGEAEFMQQPRQMEVVVPDAKALRDQVAATLVASRLSVREALAELARRVPSPGTQLDSAIGAELLQQVGWGMLRRRVRAGELGDAEAFRELEQIASAIENEPWGRIPHRLRSRRRTERRVPVAVRIRRIVDARASEALTLTTVAHAVACSVRAATTAFRKRYGLTIHDYLTRRRLVHATTLLVTTDLKLSAIAALVGFSDKTTLHRQYLRRTRLTPGVLQSDPGQQGLVVRRIGLPPSDRPDF